MFTTYFDGLRNCQELLQQLWVSHGSSNVQHRLTVVGRNLDICSSLQQQADSSRPVLSHSQMKGSSTLCVTCINHLKSHLVIYLVFLRRITNGLSHTLNLNSFINSHSPSHIPIKHINCN